MWTWLGCWPISKAAVIYAEGSTWLDQWEAVEVRRVVFIPRFVNLFGHGEASESQSFGLRDIKRIIFLLSADPAETDDWLMLGTEQKPPRLTPEVSQDFLERRRGKPNTPIHFFLQQFWLWMANSLPLCH